MSIIVRYGIGQSMTKNIDLPIQQAITKFKINIQDGTNLNKFVRIKVNYNTKQGTYLTFLKDKVGSAETFEVVKDKSGKPVFLQFSEVSKLEENKEQQIMQRITESAVRKIIREELLKEMNEPSWRKIITDFSSALLPITGGSEKPNIQRSIEEISKLPYIKKALNNPQIQVDPANSQNVKVFFEMSNGNSYHYNVTGKQVVISHGKTKEIIYRNF